MERARYRRRPGIAWREEPEAAREALAALESGGEAGEQGTLLIVDRGRVHELNYLGAEIWKLLDGERDLEAVVDALLPRFEVGRAELEADVREFLAEIERRGWAERA